MGGVLEPEAEGHVGDGHLGGLEHLASLREPLFADPFGGCFAIDALEVALEAGERTAGEVRQLFERYGRGVVLLHHAVHINPDGLTQLEHLTEDVLRAVHHVVKQLHNF